MNQDARITISEARLKILEQLNSAGIENYLQEADMILCSLLKVSRAFLYVHPEHILTDNTLAALEDVLSRRTLREPLQYIQGFTEFYGYTQYVGPGCLIPRSETELLVEEALKKFDGGTFLDWGTGSGCISVAILQESKSSSCFSIDTSVNALHWAWKNLEYHSLLNRCLLWHSHNLDDIPVEDSTLDLVISNPPYIPSITIQTLMPEVRSFEPSIALDGGQDGLSLYYPLLEWSSRKLKPEAHVFVEIGGTDQAEKLMSCKFKDLSFSDMVKDLSNIPRVLCWRRV